MYNKTPKYNVNDIVIVEGMSYGSGEYFGHVVGVIKDVFNHRDTGEVFYHIIFNSGTPRKVFEYEIETKFYTNKFRNGYLIHRHLLASKIYRTKVYNFLTEGEFIEWVNEHFEEKSDYTTYRTQTLPLYYDPKIMDVSSMYPVKMTVKGLLEEVNKSAVERIAASTIRIDVDDAIKANYSKEEIKKMVNNSFRAPGKYYWETALAYKKIIFNGPCTIILWKDGSKTIAKLYEDIDKFDPEKGVAICFMKKMLGHTETNKILRKANKQYDDEILKSITDKLSAN